jgi:hypothetical protein
MKHSDKPIAGIMKPTQNVGFWVYYTRTGSTKMELTGNIWGILRIFSWFWVTYVVFCI